MFGRVCLSVRVYRLELCAFLVTIDCQSSHKPNNQQNEQGEVLGDIKNFQRFTPAQVIPGTHSVNGSDYTSVVVKSWVRPNATWAAKRRNATVTFESTTGVVEGQFATSQTTGQSATPLLKPCNGTQGMGGAPCDLALVASCFGAECKDLALLITADFGWSRQGIVSQSGTMSLTVSPAGFSPLTVHAILNAFSYMTNTSEQRGGAHVHPHASTPSLTLLFADGSMTGGAGFAVGVTTGGAAPWPMSFALQAVSNARVRASIVPPAIEAAADPSIGDSLYRPMRNILMWNTVYTHALHVYTPVSRTWVSDYDAAMTFVWVRSLVLRSHAYFYAFVAFVPCDSQRFRCPFKWYLQCLWIVHILQDVFFAALMMAAEGPPTERTRDLAHANLITTVFSRTVTGMVQLLLEHQTSRTYVVAGFHLICVCVCACVFVSICELAHTQRSPTIAQDELRHMTAQNPVLERGHLQF